MESEVSAEEVHKQMKIEKPSILTNLMQPDTVQKHSNSQRKYCHSVDSSIPNSELFKDQTITGMLSLFQQGRYLNILKNILI